MTIIVKVATYRDVTDHLFRLANVDYQACGGAREVERWKETAARAMAQTEGVQCLRASAYDRAQFAKAVEAVKAQLNAADDRIAQLQREPTNNSERTSTARMTRCADCMKETAIDVLAKALYQCDDLSERLDPGSEVPAGQCECGAFMYLIPTADPRLAAVEIARYVHDLVVDEFFADDELPNIEWLKSKLRDAGMPCKQSAEDEESDSCDIEVYIRAAEQHGKDDDPDHEVGDLQDHLRAMWRLLAPEQRAEFAALSDVRERVEHGIGTNEEDEGAEQETRS